MTRYLSRMHAEKREEKREKRMRTEVEGNGTEMTRCLFGYAHKFFKKLLECPRVPH